jgi:hypothetical protein
VQEGKGVSNTIVVVCRFIFYHTTYPLVTLGLFFPLLTPGILW